VYRSKAHVHELTAMEVKPQWTGQPSPWFACLLSLVASVRGCGLTSAEGDPSYLGGGGSLEEGEQYWMLIGNANQFRMIFGHASEL
jgi:hypothetical protein